MNTYTQSYDRGLRSYLISVFNNMTIALIISGLVSTYVGLNQDLAQAIWGTSLKWVVIFAPLVMVFVFSSMMNSLSVIGARIGLYIFSAVMGLSISSIFLVYHLGSIIEVFFISAATFGATALYGYTTNRDLSSWSSFLIMGLLGIIICGLVNIFLHSTAFAFAISLIAVAIFIGFTAYDMQVLKQTYYNNGEEREKLGVLGALNLYLDFINIFLNMLQLLGVRK
jgi:uncharacterized protein